MTQVNPLPRRNQVGANEWSDVETNDQALADAINGNLDNGNIATGAGIALSKLAQGSSGALTLTGGVTTLDAGQKTCSGDTTIGTSSTAVTGCSFTAAANSAYLITAIFGWTHEGVTLDAGDRRATVNYYCTVNGVATGIQPANTADAGGTGTGTEIGPLYGHFQWVALPTAGQVVRIEMKKTEVVGTCIIRAKQSHTSFQYLRYV